MSIKKKKEKLKVAALNHNQVSRHKFTQKTKEQLIGSAPDIRFLLRSV